MVNFNLYCPAQPISFDKNSLTELENENYFVSEKADGVRVLLFAVINGKGIGECFLVDRKNDYYFIPMHLPVVKIKFDSDFGCALLIPKSAL